LTILEQKVQVLVESVVRAVGVVLRETEESSRHTSPVGHALVKDLSSLQRLVGASVLALRHAIEDDHNPPSSPSV